MTAHDIPVPTEGVARLTLPDLVAHLAATDPDRDGLVAPEGRWSWAELAAEAGALAGWLRDRGVRRGDRVAVAFPNGARWLVATLAGHAAGATVVPVNTWYGEAEVRSAVERAAVVLALAAPEEIFEKDFAGILEGVAGAVPGVLGGGVHRWPAGRRRLDGVADAPGGLRIDAEPDDVGYILFTSGSTRMPKGVLLSHRSMILTGRGIGGRQGFAPGDRMWLPTPLFFSKAAANAIPSALSYGVALCVQERFDPLEALRFIEAERCTIYYGLALHARRMVEHPEFARFDLSCLRTGGGATTPGEKRMMIDVLGIEGLTSVYGMTESCGYSTLTWFDDPLDVRLDSQGTPVPAQELRIAEGEVPVPVGEQGEIQLRGAILTAYLDADVTAKAFTSDGWFRTGDAGRLDAQGRLHFVARLAEVIKCKGINVSPAEVENALRDCDGVAEAYVFGRTDEVVGQAVACALVPEDGVFPEGADLSDEAVVAAFRDGIVATLRGRVAKYNVPTEIQVVRADEVPRTKSMKVDRLELRLRAERAAAAFSS
ncbi:MAG: class I adenylate-forming enzyme family protein [Acidimicrobiia bacterium]